MGLFDYFVQSHQCPVCRKWSPDWQTKDLTPMQKSYRIGSIINKSCLPEGQDVFVVYDSCDCKCWMKMEVMFNRKSGKILGFARWDGLKQVYKLVKSWRKIK